MFRKINGEINNRLTVCLFLHFLFVKIVFVTF